LCCTFCWLWQSYFFGNPFWLVICNDDVHQLENGFLGDAIFHPLLYSGLVFGRQLVHLLTRRTNDVVVLADDNRTDCQPANNYPSMVLAQPTDAHHCHPIHLVDCNVIYSHEPFFSVKFLAAKTWFLASFFIIPIFIFQDKKDWRKAFILILIPTTILMLVVFYKHWKLGFSFEKIQVALRYLFYNHVDYSTFLSMTLPMLFVAFYLCKGKGLFLRMFLGGLILFYLVAVNLAYARAAVLAIIFSFTILVAIKWKLVNYIMPVFYAFIIFIVSFAAHKNTFIDYRPDYTRTYMRKNFKDHIIATFKGQDLSSMERVYRWIGAIRMSTDEPLLGYGPNSFYYYYKPYTVTSFVTYVSRNPEKSTTHNYFLLMLVEQGIPAMVLYGILVFAFFAQAQKVYHRFKDKFYRSCTMALAMIFAASFVNNFFSELIETHKIGAIFYLCISLLIVLDYKSRQEKTDNIQLA